MYIFAFPLSLITSDFLSGILHWFGDSYYISNKKYKIFDKINKDFFDDFKTHHIKPSEIYTNKTIGYNVFKTTFVIYPSCFIFMYTKNLFFRNFILQTTTFIFLTNYLHRLAHLQKIKKFIGF
jgi:Lipid desaturase domain